MDFVLEIPTLPALPESADMERENTHLLGSHPLLFPPRSEMCNWTFISFFNWSKISFLHHPSGEDPQQTLGRGW